MTRKRLSHSEVSEILGLGGDAQEVPNEPVLDSEENFSENKRGRPKVYADGKIDKSLVTLKSEQRAWLDQVCLDIRNSSGFVADRGILIRSILDFIISQSIDFSKCCSIEDINNVISTHNYSPYYSEPVKMSFRCDADVMQAVDEWRQKKVGHVGRNQALIEIISDYFGMK